MWDVVTTWLRLHRRVHDRSHVAKCTFPVFCVHQLASLCAIAGVLATQQAQCVQVGSNYFRIHPKGTGIVCIRDGGLPALTFVEEYLGEVHAPWRWFEIQVRHACCASMECCRYVYSWRNAAACCI